MEKFYINEPMLYKTEIVYGPFHSQDYLHPKFSRINGCFDVSMIVNIKFCMLMLTIPMYSNTSWIVWI